MEETVYCTGFPAHLRIHHIFHDDGNKDGTFCGRDFHTVWGVRYHTEQELKEVENEICKTCYRSASKHFKEQ